MRDMRAVARNADDDAGSGDGTDRAPDVLSALSGEDGTGRGTERRGKNDRPSAGGAEKLAEADAVCAEGAGKGKIVGLERTG